MSEEDYFFVITDRQKWDKVYGDLQKAVLAMSDLVWEMSNVLLAELDKTPQGLDIKLSHAFVVGWLKEYSNVIPTEEETSGGQGA